MHLDHEHTHEHTHIHEHEHTHGGDAHSHEHTHEHSHSHEHTHEHLHEHGHAHEHSHGGELSPKTLALLKYMLSHNEEHARELAESGLKLAEAGKTDAARLIGDAVRCFDQGNEKLGKAVELFSKEG